MRFEFVHRFANRSIQCPHLGLHARSSRRGVSTVMMLIFLPCLLVLTIMVSEIGSMYVGKTELRHSLEAGALAAVRIWKDRKADPKDAYAAALAFAAANTVRGECLQLNRMVVVTPASANGPAIMAPAGSITLGSVVPNKSSKWKFRPDVSPGKNGFAAVQLEMTQRIQGNVSDVFGLTPPKYEVHGIVTARANEAGELELIRAANEKER